jgi:hypothetical protein
VLGFILAVVVLAVALLFGSAYFHSQSVAIEFTAKLEQFEASYGELADGKRQADALLVEQNAEFAAKLEQFQSKYDQLADGKQDVEALLREKDADLKAAADKLEREEAERKAADAQLADMADDSKKHSRWLHELVQVISQVWSEGEEQRPVLERKVLDLEQVAFESLNVGAFSVHYREMKESVMERMVKSMKQRYEHSAEIQQNMVWENVREMGIGELTVLNYKVDAKTFGGRDEIGQVFYRRSFDGLWEFYHVMGHAEFKLAQTCSIFGTRCSGTELSAAQEDSLRAKLHLEYYNKLRMDISKFKALSRLEVTDA